ncbi:MAG: hypothetical protein ACI835_001180 [Planctomycetota bacterium]|jgi:hypothetical protein
MDGALTIHQGVLYVGRHAKTADVRSFDLDGHPLETHFRFKDAESGRSSVAGLCVDDDHRVWIADSAASRLRSFTLVGRPVATLIGSAEARDGLGVPVDVCCRGADDDLLVTVASSGRRRHALHELHPASKGMRSLRPLGDPDGAFADICDLTQEEELLYVCERRARRIQIFRDGQFHYAIDLRSLAPDSEPCAVAPAGQGRILIAFSGREEGKGSSLLLTDSGGKLLRVIAESGGLDGDVEQPCDIAVDVATSDRESRIAVLDHAAERLQIFTMDGRCYGSFVDDRGNAPKRRTDRRVRESDND